MKINESCSFLYVVWIDVLHFVLSFIKFWYCALNLNSNCNVSGNVGALLFFEAFVIKWIHFYIMLVVGVCGAVISSM